MGAAAGQIEISSTHRRDDHPAPLRLVNLLHDASELAALLDAPIDRHTPTNAFLLAAGLLQIADDYMHRGSLDLSVIDSLRNVSRFRERVAALVAGLAQEVMAGTESGIARHDAHVIRLDLDHLPTGLRRSVVRLPSCFRTLDQRPGDQARLALQFCQRHPDRQTHVLLIGLRTSGTYLAPLIAASLRNLGYTSIEVLTMRPGQHWLLSERLAIRSAIARRGRLLVTDDPPGSGGTLARALRQLIALGCPAEQITLLLQLYGEGKLPTRLTEYELVALPWTDWEVQSAVEPDAVRRSLLSLLGPGAAVSVLAHEKVLKPEGRRGHVEAVYTVHVRESRQSETRIERIFVKGVGLGYLGEHALAVAELLPTRVPRVYGVADGLMFRTWIDDTERVRMHRTEESDGIAAGIASYCVERSRMLAVDQDYAPRLRNRDPIWQFASDIIGHGFGRAARWTRPASHLAARRLLDPDQPSVIDGSMEHRHWFQPASSTAFIKVDFDERAFSSRDRYCYDPIYDLASAAVSFDGIIDANALRRHYETLGATTVGPEKWFLYQLIRMYLKQHDGGGDDPSLERAMSRVIQHYWNEVLYSHLPLVPTGSICAIDIDGVLETDQTAFSLLTPLAARALWALMAHGHRVVLASGRSLSDVRSRTSAYRCFGGVAEYGSVAWVEESDRVEVLVEPADLAVLNEVRVALGGFQDVRIDPDYRYSVRAFMHAGNGSRVPVTDGILEEAFRLANVEGGIQVIRGRAQVDLVAASVNKAHGVRQIVNSLIDSTNSDARLAFAIGDSQSDLQLLQTADQGFAPANADPALKTWPVRVVSKARQHGFALAVGRFLRHDPGGCPVCRMPAQSRDEKLLGLALGAHDAGRFGKLWTAARMLTEGLAA